MIGIYKITSPTGKVYIGQSVNIERRFSYYKGLHCKSQTALYNSLLKHGFDKHIFEVLEYCDILDLNEKERYYQDLYSVINSNGLNCILTRSSDKSGIYSIETTRKMSMALKGRKMTKEQVNRMSIYKTGLKHSEETKNKISLAHKGRIPFWSFKIILNTETGIFYNGLAEAVFVTNIKYSTLSNMLNGNKKNKTNLIYV